MTKLVYIGGYGHSGSTLLEYLMAGSPAVIACGEVVGAIRKKGRKSKQCTCGRDASVCPVWSFLYQDECAWTHAELLDALVQRGVKAGHSAIVDSSKTAWGSFGAPFRLKRKFGSQFVLVHLLRDPRAVCWSVLKKKNRRDGRKGRKPRHYTLRCGWFVLGWWLANLSCDLFGVIYPRNYLRLRYEDLARAPTEALSMLFDRLLPDASWNAGEHALDNRHQLHGNHVRFREIAIEDVKEDLQWKSEMPPEYSRAILVMNSLLRWQYGY